MRRNLHHARIRGYAAILSVLLIAVLCTGLLLTVSSKVFMTHANEIRHIAKVRSSVLAYSCLFVALESFSEDGTYAPHNAVVQISNDTCTITRLIVSTTTAAIYAQATISAVSSYVKSAVALRPDGSMALEFMGPSTSTPP